MSSVALIVVAVVALWGPGAPETAAAAAATINQEGTCVRVGPAQQADYTVEVSVTYVQGPRWGYWGQGGSFSMALDHIRATAVTKRAGAVAGIVEIQSPVASIAVGTGSFWLSGPVPAQYGEIGRDLGRKLLALLEKECQTG